MQTNIIASSSASAAGFARYWQYRDLVRNLVIKDLKVRYQGATLGFLWSLGNPSPSSWASFTRCSTPARSFFAARPVIWSKTSDAPRRPRRARSQGEFILFHQRKRRSHFLAGG